MHSTEENRQRGFCDGLGLFLGEKSRDFLSLVVKSVNARAYLKLLEYLVLPVMQHINTISDAVFQ